MSFTDSEEDILIGCVANHPAIYDVNHEDYRNILTKEKIWEEIAKELDKTSEDCKKKWKFVRDGYQRFKKRNKMGPGYKAPKNSKNRRYQQLWFLDDVSEHGSGEFTIPEDQLKLELHENVDSNSDHSDEQEQDTLHTKHQTTTKSRYLMPQKIFLKNRNTDDGEKKKKRQKSANSNDRIVKMWKERNQHRQYLLKGTVKKKDDDIELFCRHIGEVLRNLPALYKAQAKKDISVMISDYEIKAAQNPVSTQASPPSPQANPSSTQANPSSGPSSSS